MSTDGVEIELRLGDSGGIEATSYLNTTVSTLSGGTSISNDVTASGFSFVQAADSASGDFYYGRAILENPSGNSWVLQNTMVSSGTNDGMHIAGGEKALSGTLTQFTIYSTSGTFSGGTFSVNYEG